MDTKRTAVVTSEADEAAALKDAFENEGWECSLLESIAEARELAKRLPLDLLVIELDPGSEEESETREFKEKSGDALSLIYISRDTSIDTDNPETTGAGAIFTHPIDVGAVVSVARRLMQPEEFRQKRARDRVPCDFPVLLREKLTRQMISSRVLNLSSGGMFIALAPGAMPKRFDVYSFAFRIEPDNIEVTGRGVVQWVQKTVQPLFPMGFGIEFYALDEGGDAAIAQWLNKKS